MEMKKIELNISHVFFTIQDMGNQIPQCIEFFGFF